MLENVCIVNFTKYLKRFEEISTPNHHVDPATFDFKKFSQGKKWIPHVLLCSCSEITWKTMIFRRISTQKLWKKVFFFGWILLKNRLWPLWHRSCSKSYVKTMIFRPDFPSKEFAHPRSKLVMCVLDLDILILATDFTWNSHFDIFKGAKINFKSKWKYDKKSWTAPGSIVSKWNHDENV